MPLQSIYDHFLKVRKVSTDTRKISRDDIFFALSGENFNGNEFAGQALDKGASMVVVDQISDVRDPRVIVVDNVLATLQGVARLYRQSFTIPVFAITGSNGKTTTKELMREVLKKKLKVHATAGNLNNHIGVPLTLLSIPADCEFVIVEMGANHVGEIAELCSIAEPDHGLITSIGKAHLEGFGSIDGVKKAKKELFDYLDAHNGKIFVNTEVKVLTELSSGMNFQGYDRTGPGFALEELQSDTGTISFRLTSGDYSGDWKTGLTGSYNFSNILTAVATGLYFGVPPGEIGAAISEYIPDNNRSQLKQTGRNVLIMDAYNANPTSMENALAALAGQPSLKKFFVLGDMLELGESAAEEHREILAKASQLGLAGITVGPLFYSLRSDSPFKAFLNNADAGKYLESLDLRDHMILLKGSRGIRIEEVASVL